MRKNTALICVFLTGSLKLKIVQLQSYNNISKVMRFGKVYFDPLASFIRALWLHL